MSLARLTSISTQTLTLLLERQRLESLGQTVPQSTAAHIARNLGQIRTGILGLERSADTDNATAARVLREQYERMRVMLGRDGEALEPMRPLPPPAPAPAPVPASPTKRTYVPYSDEPPPEPEPDGQSDGELLGHQRQIMDEQDTQLDHLSNSIRRQRDISLQIGDELDVHTGLLEALDEEVDQTENRLSGARRRLEMVSDGARRNCSTLTIAAIIFILLILIVALKTGTSSGV